jgi:hypothetical protein
MLLPNGKAKYFPQQDWTAKNDRFARQAKQLVAA